MAVALKRTLGTTDLTLLVIGNVIGSGIFLVPSSVLQQSGGSVAVASAVWLVGGVLSLLGALSYGELGAMEQGSGGLYAYIRDGFGALRSRFGSPCGRPRRLDRDPPSAVPRAA